MTTSMQQQGTLFLLVQADIDVEKCLADSRGDASSSTADGGGAQWVTRRVSRNNLSYSTLIEEIALTGHPVVKHQAYLYDHAVVPSVFEHVEGNVFHLAGHFSNKELQRITSMGNVSRWSEHISEVPTSSNVLRNIAGSMISSFEEGANGLEAISPLLNKLNTGNVVIELRQDPEAPELADAMYTTVGLFKRVLEQQGVETILCHAPAKRAISHGGGAFPVSQRYMTVCSLSDQFNLLHMESLDTVTCLGKHVVAHMNASDPALVPVFTDQFAHCEVASSEGKNLCFRARPNSVDIFRFSDDDPESVDPSTVVEFAVGSTEELDVSVKALSNQMDYMVHNTAAQEVQPADITGGVPIEQGFYRALRVVCGQRVAQYNRGGAPRNATTTAAVSAAAGSSSFAADDLGASSEQQPDSDRIGAEAATGDYTDSPSWPSSPPSHAAATTMRSNNDVPGAHLEEKAKALYNQVVTLTAATEADRQMHETREKELAMRNKKLEAELAHVRLMNSKDSDSLNACREDVHALRIFSQSRGNERAVAQVARNQLVQASQRVSTLQKALSRLESSKTPGIQGRGAKQRPRTGDAEPDNAANEEDSGATEPEQENDGLEAGEAAPVKQQIAAASAANIIKKSKEGAVNAASAASAVAGRLFQKSRSSAASAASGLAEMIGRKTSVAAPNPGPSDNVANAATPTVGGVMAGVAEGENPKGSVSRKLRDVRLGRSREKKINVIKSHLMRV